jgi:hypothetical protein
MVCKTYIISQVIYLLGSLPLNDEYADEINNIVVNFISGTDRPIERRRHFLSAELGGYDMFDIRNMDTSIKATWIKRWRTEMNQPDYSGSICIGTVQIEADMINGRLDNGGEVTLLDNIMTKWNSFKKGYYEILNNVQVARLFGNTTLGIDGVSVDMEVFGRALTVRPALEIGEAMVKDFFTANGQVKDKGELEEQRRIQINWAEYFRLRGVLVRIQRDFRIEWEGGVMGRGLNEFIQNQKKGCARYRRVLSGRWSRKHIENDPRTIGVAIPGGDGVEWDSRSMCELNFGIWTISHLPAEVKNFCFRLLHGRLYLNQQRTRFADVGRWCTFCGIKKAKELRGRGINREQAEYEEEMERLPAENVAHLFWECSSVGDLIKRFFNEMSNTNNLEIDKNKFFTGWCGKSKDNTNFILICVHVIKYLIFNFRNKIRIPTFFTLKEEFWNMLGSLSTYGRWRGEVREIRQSLRGIFRLGQP